LEQNLVAWQPVHYPPYIIALFYCMCLVLLPIGIGMYFSTVATITVTQRYDDACTMTRNSYGSPVCNISKLAITIPVDMTPPIYMYYYITGFYQNYRLYAKSRYDSQLAGYTNLVTTDLSDCSPFLFYGDRNNLNGTYTMNDVYMPCGMVAWSMFNDTFDLYSSSIVGNNTTYNLLCNCSNPDNVNCTKNGITLITSDLYRRGAVGRNYTTTYYGEAEHYLPDIMDPDFQVWMLTAHFPDFRKLYRIINVPLKAGTYYLDVNQRWPGAYGGTKSIILSTGSWIGGQNLFFAILNIAVGGTAFLVATAFIFAFAVQYIVRRGCGKDDAPK
jgi:hypothetical protein